MVVVVLIVITLICFLVHRIIVERQQREYFRIRGVQPTNWKWALLRYLKAFTSNLAEMVNDVYNAHESERLFGMFDNNTPGYILKDPAVIKQIAIKDFNHFVDRRMIFDSLTDPLLGKSLVTLRGEKWQKMRSALSPAFTGSKMRQMFELMQQCAEDMCHYFMEEFQLSGKELYEMRDIFSKIANDIIATCAFGVKSDSLRDSKNEIFLAGKKIVKFQTVWNILKLLLKHAIPWKWLANLIKIQILDDNTRQSFSEMILTTMKVRDEKQIYRPDMIHLLMEMRKANMKASDEVGKTEWADDDLVAQCFNFFLAGFETTSTVMAFLAYEIAVNIDIQSRLFDEIERYKSVPLTYDDLQSMTYLDMVVAEVLRKWPPAPLIDRICTKDYVYRDDNGIEFHMEKGSINLFLIFGLHRDPKYFPDPEKFDPERFNKENRPFLNSNAYMPFGLGPRNCIGSRFALMEIKVIFYYLLKNFEIKVSDKTSIPLRLKKTPGGMTPEDVHLVFKPRSNQRTC